MTLKFEVWLKDQQSREDEIGELARIPSMNGLEPTPSKRVIDEHHSWVDIVVRIVDERHVSVFNDAWQEFLLAKQAAQGASD
ncbi:MAG TPA: hypothetical protein PLH39_01120 [Promineifilum sp.]|nr:hypothetical protein [Promineifilum sp.]